VQLVVRRPRLVLVVVPALLLLDLRPDALAGRQREGRHDQTLRRAGEQLVGLWLDLVQRGVGLLGLA